MGSVDISFDASDLNRKLKKLQVTSPFVISKALMVIAEEVLRLSQKEVPHDTGFLQNTGVAQSVSLDHKIVGYHTPYAARLHEHPEYRFRKGRKGKYLEDPIKNNKGVFLKYFGQEIEKGFKATNG